MKHARPDYNRIQDPLGIIPKAEPMFLIRAKDAISGDAVRAWANLAEASGASPEMLAAARDHAKLMDVWPGKKTPDMPV